MSGISGLPPIPMYELYSKNETQYADAAAKSNPSTALAVQYLRSQAPNLTTPTALLQNYRALQVVLGAFNMSGMINEQGLLKQLMTQNPAAPNSLVQQLANPTYLNFAKVMANWNPPPLSNPQTLASITQQYETNQFEASAGQQSPGMQAALYFTRTIGAVTTIPEILADPTLLNVAETALGLPVQFGLLNYNQQVNILSTSLDLTKFQNPSYVNQFVQKFLVLNQENPQTPAPPATVSDLIGGGASGGGILSLFA